MASMMLGKPAQLSFCYSHKNPIYVAAFGGTVMAEREEREIEVTEEMIRAGAAVVRETVPQWLGPFSDRFLAEEVFLAMTCASPPPLQSSSQILEAG